MKKITLLLGLFSLVLVSGVAFAENSAMRSDSQEVLTNGITYFDLGPSEECGQAAGGGQMANVMGKPLSNGVTYFDYREPRPGSKASCHGPSVIPGWDDSLPKNGITVF